MSAPENCEELFEKISELIDGELDGPTGDQIMAHINACPHCRACFATFKKSVEVFRRLGRESAPPNLVADLKAFIHKSQD
jgi:anti-sigma factor RsiW